MHAVSQTCTPGILEQSLLIVPATTWMARGYNLLAYAYGHVSENLSRQKQLKVTTKSCNLSHAPFRADVHHSRAFWNSLSHGLGPSGRTPASAGYLLRQRQAHSHSKLAHGSNVVLDESRQGKSCRGLSTISLQSCSTCCSPGRATVMGPFQGAASIHCTDRA